MCPAVRTQWTTPLINSVKQMSFDIIEHECNAIVKKSMHSITSPWWCVARSSWNDDERVLAIWNKNPITLITGMSDDGFTPFSVIYVCSQCTMMREYYDRQKCEAITCRTLFCIIEMLCPLSWLTLALHTRVLKHVSCCAKPKFSNCS